MKKANIEAVRNYTDKWFVRINGQAFLHSRGGYRYYSSEASALKAGIKEDKARLLVV